jgi:SAM-dependent methyltransferase
VHEGEILAGNAYRLSNAWARERERLELIERVADPVTIRQLEGTGVAPGSRCLEVGAGAGSIARWLCDRVGPRGRVVATDIDTRFLDEMNLPNLEVLRHDVAREPLPEGGFDLIHARLLLMHPPEREQILARMVDALTPGGWIVIEDADSFALHAAPPGPFRTVMERVTLPDTGIDWQWARTVPQRFTALGLADVAAEAHTSFFQGGSTIAELRSLSMQHLSQELLKAGLLEQSLLEQAVATLADPSQWSVSSSMVSARGRRRTAP